MPSRKRPRKKPVVDLPPELAKELGAYLRDRKPAAPLCPACGRRPQETEDGLCSVCSRERRERDLAKKRRWWTKHADEERLANRSLEEIADDIRESYDVGKESYEQSIEAYLAIGRDLLQAREIFRADQDFGRWFRRQRFPFGQQWAWMLREAAAHEDEIRAVTTQGVTDVRPSIKRALAIVRAGTVTPRPRTTEEDGCRHCPIHCDCA